VPVSMLARPMIRSVVSSISSIACNMCRHRCGAIKGSIPSITSIRQNAIAISCHIVMPPVDLVALLQLSHVILALSPGLN